MNIAANPAPGFQRNPSHTIVVERFDGAVTVTFANAIVASSERALVLREANYPPVFYIPFEDIRFELLTRSDTSTHCPFKGNASYWSVRAAGDEVLNDVMWSYERPYDEMTGIKGHGAFYRDKVRIEASPNPGATGAR